MSNGYSTTRKLRYALPGLIVWALLVSQCLLAQPVLVKDINPGPGGASLSRWVKLNGTLFFGAGNGLNGNELWKSDGTTAGTVLLKDINPGPAGSTPVVLTDANGTLYFTADNGATGNALWKSNGTAAGTVLVKDISPGSEGAFVVSFTNVNGTLFFMTLSGQSTYALWKSDGTAAGTVKLKEFNVVPIYFFTPQLVDVNGTLFFAAADDTHGVELWKSDGTTAGTVLVKDIYPGSSDYGLNNSSPHSMVNFNGTLYFSADDGVHNRELWKSDGTAAGTVLAADLEPGVYDDGSTPVGSAPSGLIVFNNTLFFVAQPADPAASLLYRSDGTAEGTEVVRAFFPPREGPYVSLSSLNVEGDAFYFVSETYSPSFGSVVTLWQSTGGEPSSVLTFEDYYNGSSTIFISNNVTGVNGTLYFTANDGTTGSELWKSGGPGTAAMRVSDLYPGPNGSAPANLTNLNGTLYFTADDGSRGFEPWKLNLDCITPTAVGLPVRGSTVCAGRPATVAIDSTEAGITYTAFADGVTFAEASSNGGTLTLTIPADKLAGGRYQLAVKAAGCTDLYLTETAAVTVFDAATVGPRGPGATTHRGQKATLSVNEAPSDFTYRWYTQAAGGTPVATGTTFTTPALTDTTSYFVAAYRDGCGESARTEVVVDVIGLPAIIGFDPAEAVAPGSVTVRGKNFAGATEVRVGGVPVSFYAYSNEAIHLSIPEGTASGIITVTTPAGKASSAASLQITTRFALRINAGGGSYTTPEGKVFAADNYFTGGRTSAVSGEIYGTRHDELYQTARWGEFSYNLPTGNGTFQVTLHFAEIYWGIDRPGGDDSRRFHVNAEGSRKLTEYNIWYAFPNSGPMAARQVTFPVAVADGILNLDFLKGSADNPLLSAIEVTPVSNTFRVNAGGHTYTATDGRVFEEDAYALGKSYFTGGGGRSLGCPCEAANTTEDELYFSERYGEFTYTFPTGNGTFDVVLHFADIFAFYLPNKFNVDIEGSRKLTEYDIYAKTGGINRAVQETFRVTVTDGNLNLAFRRGSAGDAKVSAIEVVPVTTTLRLNAGGPAFATPDGRVFNPDNYVTGGNLTKPVSGEVANTTDDALYRNGRYGENFSYNIPSGNGTFDVTLHFNETYWGNLAPGGVGSRKFNVDIEGSRKLTDYDIFARAGGAMRAVRETFRVTVNDGRLNLLFSKGNADLARVEAIEISGGKDKNFLRAINLNGDPVVIDGNAWQGKGAPDYTTNGRSLTNSTVPLLPATDSTRTAMIRSSVWHWSNLQLNLARVPAGTYEVYLHTWEDNFPQTFSVVMEGKTVLANYTSGPAGTWKKLGPFAVSVTDGTLNLATSGGNVNLSGIEIYRTEAGSAARLAAAGSDSPGAETLALTVYPNPVRETLTVGLAVPADRITGSRITSPSGHVLVRNGHQATGEYRLQMKAGHLKSGLYLLVLESAHGRQVVRFMKQ